MCMCYSLRFYQYQGRQDTHTNTNIYTLSTSRALSFLGVEPQLNLLTKRVLRTRLIALTVCCSVLQCVAVCCSVLQCVAVCCSVLQCVAVYVYIGYARE